MMIDLRSDTFTVPDAGMRDAMASAPVGDDVYAEDPSINELQDRVAAMFGKEAALFVPSGTMGNQISLALHASTGDEVIAERNAHIFHYENAATSVIARAQIHGLDSDMGSMVLEDVLTAIRPSAYYYPRTACIAVENTHNRHGGTVLSHAFLKNLRDVADHAGLPLHCDGARIWNAMTASGVSASTYGALFDTMSVCFSKGLGAPVGSAILGTRTHIERARRWRKMLGGGMRQAGILAAAAIYALDTNMPKLAADHARARRFAESIATIDGVRVDLDRVQTNIVMFTVKGMTDAEFVGACQSHGLRIAPIKPGTMRAVFYHQVDDAMTDAAIDAIRLILQAH
jgi:threonine aldolase